MHNDDDDNDNRSADDMYSESFERKMHEHKVDSYCFACACAGAWWLPGATHKQIFDTSQNEWNEHGISVRVVFDARTMSNEDAGGENGAESF